MPDSEIIGAYDALAPDYREYSSGRQEYLDAVDALVVANLEPGSRLLDVGSGDGRRLAKIRDAAALAEVVAVEPSAEMARLCEATVGVRVYRELGENIDRLDIGRFDAATALWNIFGHIPDARTRLRTLVNIRDKLRPGGKLILDINNRHNAAAYGRWRVMFRVCLDRLAFDESRGDARFNWTIGGRNFAASGHLFTAAEFEGLVEKAGLELVSRCSVNYASGEISDSRYRGQLVYLLRRAS